MEAPTQQPYSFGPFVLDPVEKRLLRDGQPVALPPKALDTLLTLVEHRGHMMEKGELLNRVWPNTFVEEATLTQNIFTLRKALEDSPDDHEYIETVPKRGYRFVARVSMAQREVRIPERPAFLRAPLSRVLLWVTLGILVASVSLGIYRRVRSPRPAPSRTPRQIMLAALPFANLSGDPKQEYFSDGLTEEMIAQLSRLNPERLRVIARTSSMQYKGTVKSAAQIGHELGVDYILESSVRREGNRARITTQLVRVSDQTHLWSQSYDRDVREILPLQGEVAQAIAREIEVKLSPLEQAHLAEPRSINPEAYQLYLQGRYFWNKRNTEALHRALEYFQSATEKDPRFALAYSGLADSYVLGEYFQDMPAAEWRQRAKQAAQKALELDDTLAEAHTSMTLAGGWDRKPVETEAHFKRALELNPNYATAHHWYSLFLKDTGRMEEAIAEIERAHELDPLSLVINADVGLVHYFARRYDKAIEACQKTLELDPNFRLAHWELGMAYESKNMYPEATKEYEIAVRLAPDNTLMYTYLARAYALSGKKREAWKTLSDLGKLPASAERPIGAMAFVYDALADRDQAFAWLEKAYQAREASLSWSLRLDPRFDDLRGDPRFADLMRRIGLSP